VSFRRSGRKGPASRALRFFVKLGTVIFQWLSIRRTIRVGPASERRKRNRGRTALLALNAELRCSKSRARTMERNSRRDRRELEIIVFPGNVGVKENPEILLCKTGRGGEDGPRPAPQQTWQHESRRYKTERCRALPARSAGGPTNRGKARRYERGGRDGLKAAPTKNEGTG